MDNFTAIQGSTRSVAHELAHERCVARHECMAESEQPFVWSRLGLLVRGGGSECVSQRGIIAQAAQRFAAEQAQQHAVSQRGISMLRCGVSEHDPQVSTTVEKGASSDGRKGGHAITMEG